MQPRRGKRILRHKVPNLCEPGLKFDSFQHPTPLFFNKVSNTLKLLEEPIKKEGNSLITTQEIFRLAKKQAFSNRIKELSRPRMNDRSLSLPQKHNLHRSTKHTFSGIKSSNASYFREKPRAASTTGTTGEIVGSGLAPLPLEKILAYRQEQMRIKEKTLNAESDDDQDLPKNHKDVPEDFTGTKQDFMKWLGKIVDNQEALYQEYEKGLLDKVSIYERRKDKYKIQFDGGWK